MPNTWSVMLYYLFFIDFMVVYMHRTISNFYVYMILIVLFFVYGFYLSVVVFACLYVFFACMFVLFVCLLLEPLSNNSICI